MGKDLKNFLEIDRKLLPVKCHYFLFLAALACILPFRALFAKQNGLSGTEIGFIFFTSYILRIVTNPLFGFLLDRFRRFRLTISLSLIVLAVSHVCWIFVPQTYPLGDHHDLNASQECSCSPSLGVGDPPSLRMYGECKSGQNRRRTSNGTLGLTCDVACDHCSCSCGAKTKVHILRDVSECDADHRMVRGRLTVEMTVTDETHQNFVPITDVVRAASRKSCRCALEFGGDSSVTGASSLVNCSGTQYASDSGNCSTCTGASSTGNITTVTQWTLNFGNCSAMIHQGTNQSGESDSVTISNFPESTSIFLLMDNHSRIITRLSLHNEFEIPLFRRRRLLPDNRSSVATFDCNWTVRCLLFLESGRRDFTSVQFWSLYPLICISCVLIGGLISMVDAVCYELLQDQKNESEYGRQRMWGTVGWAIGALAAGYVNYISESADYTNYSVSFCILATLLVLDALAIQKLRVERGVDNKNSPYIAKKVCLLLVSSPEIAYNAVLVCLAGGLSEFLWSYQFWFMQQELGSSQLLMGLAESLQSAFELPCFLVSGWFLKRMGHAHCTSVTLLCLTLRYLCFALMRDPWWSLAAAMFHGPAFGLFYASMTMYAKERAPPGTEATVQSLQHLCFEGIGAAAGNMLGGLGVDRLGARSSFVCACALGFVLFTLNVLTTALVSKRRRKEVEITSAPP